MSEIPYYDIEMAIANILKDDATLKDFNGKSVTVHVEQKIPPAMPAMPWVGIYLDGWETPAEDEKIAAGTKFTTFLILELWLFTYALEQAPGARTRDRLLQKVKEILKKPANRKIGELALMTRFEGGTFMNPKTEGKNKGFTSGVSIKLRVEVRE